MESAKPAFPYDADSPTRLVKRSLDLFITHEIPLEFRVPEVRPRRRRAAPMAPGMAMPETAVNEDRDLPGGQNDVRPARQSGRMQPEAQARAVKALAEHDFWLGISAADTRHHTRPRAGINYVDHGSNPVIFAWT